MELHGSIMNNMKNIQNFTIKNSHTLVIHPNLYVATDRNGGAKTLENVELSNIRNLKVAQDSFKDMRVTNKFYLGNVHMGSVLSEAFSFSYVKDFSIFDSKFGRLSRHGINLERCQEFSVLGMTHFGSLASHAIKVKCNKFSLAYNWFSNLESSSFDVEYRLCDIQGNVFHRLAGKPFQLLVPASQGGATEISMAGFVFRENKFAASLPFSSLTLPSFNQLSLSGAYLDIENNHFSCSCDHLAWFSTFGKLGYTSDRWAEVGHTMDPSTITFIRQVYNTAGSCIKCDQQECVDTGVALREFVGSAITLLQDKTVACGDTAVALQNFDEKNDGEDEDTLGKGQGNKIIENIKFQTVNYKYKRVKMDKDKFESVKRSQKLPNSFKMLNHNGQKIAKSFFNSAGREESLKVLLLATLCIF